MEDIFESRQQYVSPKRLRTCEPPEKPKGGTGIIYFILLVIVIGFVMFILWVAGVFTKKKSPESFSDDLSELIYPADVNLDNILK